jgi:hypothetical protein
MFSKYTKQEVYDVFKQSANILYAYNKILQMGYSKSQLAYIAPEQLPSIQSLQVKSTISLLVEVLSLIPIEMDYIVDKYKNHPPYGVDSPDEDGIQL